MKKNLTISFILVIVAFSCSKDKDAPGNNCSLTARNVAGAYKITKVTYKASASATEVDYIDVLFEACEKDDIYTFKNDGTYQISDNSTLCSPTSNDTGTWSLDMTGIIIDGDPALATFDCKTLVIGNYDTQVAGDQLRITLTRQ